jgi:L-fucono-1,5-lactonase
MTDHAAAVTDAVDAHVHFWRYDAAEYGWIGDDMAPLRRDFTPADLRRILPPGRIGACVAVQARQSLAENDWLLGLADEDPLIAGVVGWVDLRAANVDRQLEAFAAHPLAVGVRHVIQDEPPGFMCGEAFRRGLSRVARFGLAYDILIYAPQLAEACDLVAAFPEQRFVLDHLGKPDIRGGGFDAWVADLRRLASHPHVCAKLSGLVTEADWRRWTPADIRPYLETALELFGPDRLMIGSDWPVCTVAAPYDTVLAIADQAIGGLTDAERERVCGGTARAFWRLRSET